MEILLFIFSLSALATHVPDSYIDVGIAVHSNHLDGPEFLINNPLATIEIGIEKKRIKVYYEHTSSIPYWEQGNGMNQIGVKYRVWSGNY